VALPFVQLFAGKGTQICGPAGSGMAVKCVNNMLNTTHLLVAAEGLLALTKMGIKPSVALACINSSSGRSLQTQERMPQEVLSRRFGYGFKLGLMRKDCETAKTVLDEQLGEAAVLLPRTAGLLRAAEERFGTNADYTEAVRLFEEEAGALIEDPPERSEEEGPHRTVGSSEVQHKLFEGPASTMKAGIGQ